MNSVTTSTIGRLALGASRLGAVTNVAGAVRHASTHPTTAIPKPTAAIIKISSLAEETAVELKSPSRLQLKSEPGNKAMPKGHGDRIWAFHHIEQGQVIYSTTPVISVRRQQSPSFFFFLFLPFYLPVQSQLANHVQCAAQK